MTTGFPHEHPIRVLLKLGLVRGLLRKWGPRPTKAPGLAALDPNMFFPDEA